MVGRFDRNRFAQVNLQISQIHETGKFLKFGY